MIVSKETKDAKFVKPHIIRNFKKPLKDDGN